MGVSLADAERETRIRRLYLEALEAEDSAKLPPPVYTRGFVRTYAEFLGLNPQAMVDLYQPAAQRPPTPPLRPAVPRIAIPREIPVRPLAYLVGAILLVVALVYGWDQYQSAAAALREQEGTAAARRGTPTVPPRVPTPNPIALPSPGPSPAPTAEPSPSASPTPVPIDGILVELRAASRVYVEASVDGQQTLADTLPGGAQRTLPIGKEVVVLVASNGSALELTVNGHRQATASSTGPTEFTWRR